MRVLENICDEKLCQVDGSHFVGIVSVRKNYELLQSFRLLTMWHAKSNHALAFSFSVIALGTVAASKSAGARA